MTTFLRLLDVALSIFLILLILIQRGRGGGLAGAFGGAGGQSAVGTRAGDVFTRITFVCVLVWFLLNGVTGAMMRNEKKQVYKAAPAEKKAPAESGADAMDALQSKPATSATESATKKTEETVGSDKPELKGNEKAAGDVKAEAESEKKSGESK